MEPDGLAEVIAALNQVADIHAALADFDAMLDELDTPVDLHRPGDDEPWEAGTQRRRLLRESLKDHEPGVTIRQPHERRMAGSD
jgi:hypothetical protein